MIAHVDLHLQQCEAEVWLNDFPVHRTLAGEHPTFVTAPVVEYLRHGVNTLTLVPYPGDHPSVSRTGRRVAPDPAARATARLVFYQEGDFPGTGVGHPPLSLVFPRDLAMADPANRSLSIQGHLEGAGGAPWSWQRAKPLTLDAQVCAAIRHVAERAQAAFTARDADFFLAFGEPYFAEYARAYPGMSTHLRAERFRRGLSPREGGPPWQVAPVDPSSFDLRLCADSRLVELIDRDFRPIVRSQSQFYPLPMFVGLLDGRLQMLR